MATDDVLDAISLKAAKARSRVPDVKAAIKAKPTRTEVNRGRAVLSALDKDLEELLKLTDSGTVDQPPDPDDPPDPDEPDDPDAPDVPTPPGARIITQNMAPTGTGGYGNPVLNLSQARNWVYSGITINGGGNCGRALLHGNCGKNVLFNGCTIKGFRLPKGIHGALFVYPGSSWSTSTDDYGLVFANTTFEDIESDDLFELKCSNVKVINCTFRNIKGGGARIRHGVGHQFISNKGLPASTSRCGPHWQINNINTDWWLFAGNLPGEADRWPPLHQHGGGRNMQAAFNNRLVGNAGVDVGHVQSGLSSYPAKNNIVAPNHLHYRTGKEVGTQRAAVGLPQMRLDFTLRAMAEQPALNWHDKDPEALSEAETRLILDRMAAMQRAYLDPPDELLRAVERTHRDEDEEWFEHLRAAVGDELAI